MGGVRVVGREAVGEGEEVHVQVFDVESRVRDEDLVAANAWGEGDAGDADRGVHVSKSILV